MKQLNELSAWHFKASFIYKTGDPLQEHLAFLDKEELVMTEHDIKKLSVCVHYFNVMFSKCRKLKHLLCIFLHMSSIVGLIKG